MALLSSTASRMAWTAIMAAALGSLVSPPAHPQNSGATHAHGMTDSAYRAMQERGKAVMGVDQYTSTHRFDALRNGGRIELQRNSADDTAGIRHIRAHLRDLARAFKSGDFTSPHLVHMQAVTGTSIMAAKRDLITYTTRDLPRGGELVIETSDEGALAAIHRFIAFQRGEHRAGGLTDSASGNASQPAQNGRSKPLSGPPVIVPGGLPMHLTATGTTQRRALVLILHESSKPPITLVHDWKPSELCRTWLASRGDGVATCSVLPTA